ncbi:MAG TPA: YoaK family protein [Bryobacteraceae bacterium]|nr:YoaK family protein [Bryobacteraceae bacterium]
MSDLQPDTSTAESHAVSLLLLTFIAGMLDGLSYLRENVFTANMTGNMVLLGIHLTQRDFPDAGRSLVALAAFAIGCIIAGFLILEREDRGRSVMTIGFSAELFLLIIFAVLFLMGRAGTGYLVHGALIFTAAMALAVQSVVVRRLRISGVVTTFLTGTITTSMLGVVRVLRKQRAPEEKAEEQHIALLIAMLLLYFAAVVFATFLSTSAPLLVAILPSIILVAVIWRFSRSFGR